MRLLCISFSFERVFDKSRHEQSVEQIVLLMSRCRKLYAAFAQLMTVLKLATLRTKLLTEIT